MHNVDEGFISLDQEKAFDRVDHGFLFKCFKAFGSGRSFISYVKLLYTNVYSMLKINGTLTRPFLAGRGIRQGCGLSGILYGILIEPLLVDLRRQLSGISTTCSVSSSGVVTVRLSVYADDVTVVIKSDEDVNNLISSLKVYQKASSSRINWLKSATFLMGYWEDGGPPNFLIY